MRSFEEIHARYEAALEAPETLENEEELNILIDISGASAEDTMSEDGVHAYFFDNYKEDSEWFILAEELRVWVLSK